MCFYVKICIYLKVRALLVSNVLFNFLFVIFSLLIHSVDLLFEFKLFYYSKHRNAHQAMRTSAEHRNTLNDWNTKKDPNERKCIQ